MSDSHDDGSLPPSRPGAVVRMSEGESTLVGVETAAELEQRARSPSSCTGSGSGAWPCGRY